MKLKIGITGSNGVFGKKFINLYKSNYIFYKFDGDITSKNDVIKWLNSKNFDCIIHAAAKVPIKYVNDNYKYSLKVNFLGTKNLFNNLLLLKKKCFFIFLSTAQVYPFSKKPITENLKIKPISKYGKTKYLAEKYLLSKKNNLLGLSILRIFSYTDKKQSKEFFIPSIVNKIKYSKDYFVTDKLYQKRDFIHINDLCRFINHVIKYKLKGIINVGSGKSYQLNYIIKYFCKKFNKKIILNKKILKRKRNQDLYPNISRLKKSGFKFKYNIKNILDDFI